MIADGSVKRRYLFVCLAVAVLVGDPGFHSCLGSSTQPLKCTTYYTIQKVCPNALEL